MSSQSIRLALVAGTTLALAGIAQAGAPVDLSKLGPKQQAHLAANQAKQRELSHTYNYDIRPPVLRAVDVGGTVNAGMIGAEVDVSLTMVDNLAGVHSASIWVQGPNGQTASGSWNSAYDTTRAKLDVGIGMTGAGDSGTWRIVSVSLQDSNGNTSNYDEAALSALGNTTFTVKGVAGDVDAPTLTAGGSVLTPVVSRSTPPAGMLPGAGARVAANLKVGDVGVSGVQYASAEFCNEYYDCIYLSGSVPVRGKKNATLTVGTLVGEYVSTGNYTPYSIYVYDYAGNGRSYYSWDTDFSTLIDNPVVTITE